MNLDEIARVAPGDPLSAERDGQILDALSRPTAGPNVMVDSLGTLHLPPEGRHICRFEMTDAITLSDDGSGYANAYFLNWVEGDPGDNLTGSLPLIRVVDGMRMHSKMATLSPDIGAYGLAWIPDDPMVHAPYKAVWEILTMQTPGWFTASLDSDLTTGMASVVVTVFKTNKSGSTKRTWNGYDPFGTGWAAANGGAKVTVYNLPGGLTPYIFEGSSDGTVLCKWNMRESKYYIVQIECPLDEEEALMADWFYN